MTFVDRLRRYRDGHGLTWPALALRWQVPLKTLQGWAGGKPAGNAERAISALLDELDAGS